MSRLSEEHQALMQQLEQAKLEKLSVLDDRQALGLEVEQLRSHVAHMVSENEVLKQKVDKVVSNGNPEIFEAGGADEVIANWIEMDLRDGDSLLEALKSVHPPSVPEIEQMLSTSSQIRQNESSLMEYCEYFSSRFKLYNEIWRKVVEVHFAMDESFQNIREVLAANMQSVEPMIGKKSAAMDELREEIKNLFKLQYADFMNEQRRLETKITGYKIDYYNKRVEDKEAEKQRIIARNDADTKALKAKHQNEMNDKIAEMEAMRQSMQQTIDDLRAELKQELDRKESYAKELRDLHAGNLSKMKKYLKNELKRLAGEVKVEMVQFEGHQKTMERDLFNFCTETLGDTMKMISNYERRIADLNAKHKREKELMRQLMHKHLETFRGQFLQIEEDFKQYRTQAEGNLLAFCDLTTDKKNQIISEFRTTVMMLHEDVRAEVLKRDRETAALKAFHAKEKATMRSLMKTNTLKFRSDFQQLSLDFFNYQKSIEGELVVFCDMKTDQFVNHSKDSTFLLDQTHRMYLARIAVMKEDIRSEVFKRDRETADLKAKHVKEKRLMREVMKKQTMDLRGEMVALSEDLKNLQRTSEALIMRNMHVHHDIHIYDLRAEGIANAQMLKEEHRQEIIKRDSEKATLVHDYKYRILDLERQFESATGVLKEDARGQVVRLELRADQRERANAQVVETCIAQFAKGLQGLFSRAITDTAAALSPLEEYKLELPAAAVPDSVEPEPLMGRPRNGAQVYDQAISRLQSTLSKGSEETDKILQVGLSHEMWLVSQWVKLEHTRQQLHTQWESDTADFKAQVEQLKAELQDFEEHHGNVSGSLSEQISSLEEAIRSRDVTIKAREDSIAELNDSITQRRKEIAERDSNIEELKNDLFIKEEELIKLQHELEEHGQNTKKDWEECQQLIADLREQIRVNEEKYNYARKLKANKRMLGDFLRRVQGLKRTFLVSWRLKVAGFQPTAEPPPIEMDSDESENDLEMDLVEEFIQEEKRLALENNVMMESFRKAETQEKPLTIPQALKFLEEMMDRKYDTDLGDIKNQRPLRTLPNFFLEYTSRTFGLKKLAIKMLCQIIPTLEQMNEEGHPYCQLFVRLVQVNHPDPVPFQLAIFLTKIRVQFTPFAEKYQKDKEARDSKRGVKRDTGKGKDKGTSLTGGEAYVLDIIGFVYSLFEQDRRSGELMLKLLQPEGVEMYDYVIFKLCHKMAKLGLNAEGIYNMLDRDGTGSISEVEFVRSARRNLELWISNEDLSLVFKTMTGASRQLNKDTFLAKINFKAYLENCRSDLYIVTRCNFLLSLIEVYHARQKRDGAFVKGVVGQRKHTPFDIFEGLIKRMDASISPAKVQALFDEALKLSPEPDQGVSIGAFVRVLLRHPIGSLKNSPFCKRYADMKELDLEFDALEGPAEPKLESSSPSPQPKALEKKGGAKKAGK